MPEFESDLGGEEGKNISNATTFDSLYNILRSKGDEMRQMTGAGGRMFKNDMGELIAAIEEVRQAVIKWTAEGNQQAINNLLDGRDFMLYGLNVFDGLKDKVIELSRNLRQAQE